MEKIKRVLEGKFNTKTDENVLRAVEFFKSEAQEIYVPKQVAVTHEIPTPLQFYQKWVGPNLPVLIKNGCKTWNAYKKWNKSYLIDKLKDKKITVAVTPTGLGDAIHEANINGRKQEMFVLPDEIQMTMREFFTELDAAQSENYNEDSKGPRVLYIQKQNSNLTEEFPELVPDIDRNLSWATETFDSASVAINLWIGDKRAVSSLHKDPFENIYCVISGYKDFILLPPTDRPWLPHKSLPVGHYVTTKHGSFEIKKINKSQISVLELNENSESSNFGHVPWVDIDPITPDFEKYPLYMNASPIRVRVNEGDILYLPSLWFHHVRQSHKAVAVNYWYDMNFDIKYAYYQLLDVLSKHLDPH